MLIITSVINFLFTMSGMSKSVSSNVLTDQISLGDIEVIFFSNIFYCSDRQLFQSHLKCLACLKDLRHLLLMCVLLITQLLLLVGRLGSRNTV